VLDGGAGFALGLNDRGDVVGGDADGAFVVLDGKRTSIGAQLDDLVSWALAVNDARQVVGWYQPNGVSEHRAFLWHDGEVTELGELLEGASDAKVVRLNGSGIVVGFALGPTRAVRWIEEKGEYLGVCAGFERSAASDVNDSGRIVGQCWGSTIVVPGIRGILWDNGAMYAIDDLLEPNGEVEYVTWVRAISNSGYIAGLGRTAFPEFDERVIVLRPIPPIPGDTSCEGQVDMQDLLNVLSQWGPTEASTVDLDESGVIESADLELVLANWGR
jgi:probable HAF family extracellular repeat protein